MKNDSNPWVDLMLGVIQLLAGALMLYSALVDKRIWMIIAGACIMLAGWLNLVRYVRKR